MRPTSTDTAKQHKRHIKKKSGKPRSAYPSMAPCCSHVSAELEPVAPCVSEKPEPTSMWPISASSVMKKACSCGETLMDGVNHYSLQHYSWLDGVQGNLLSYHVCETRPVSRIMAEPIRQRQSHSIEIKPRWKSCSWETSPERLSDASNYSSANTPADLQLLYHLIRAL